MKDESRCKKNWLCDFKILESNDTVQVEVCLFCGKKVIYNKAEKERIDNAKYLRDHRRDFVQATGSTAKDFERIYGRKKWKEALKNFEKEKITKGDMEYGVKAAVKSAKRQVILK